MRARRQAAERLRSHNNCITITRITQYLNLVADPRPRAPLAAAARLHTRMNVTTRRHVPFNTDTPQHTHQPCHHAPGIGYRKRRTPSLSRSIVVDTARRAYIVARVTHTHTRARASYAFGRFRRIRVATRARPLRRRGRRQHEPIDDALTEGGRERSCVDVRCVEAQCVHANVKSARACDDILGLI
jgi:hypothetical protein